MNIQVWLAVRQCRISDISEFWVFCGSVIFSLFRKNRKAMSHPYNEFFVTDFRIHDRLDRVDIIFVIQLAYQRRYRHSNIEQPAAIWKSQILKLLTRYREGGRKSSGIRILFFSLWSGLCENPYLWPIWQTVSLHLYHLIYRVAKRERRYSYL